MEKVSIIHWESLYYSAYPSYLSDLLCFFYRLGIPLVWCLTSCRTQPVYDTILKKLQKIAKRMQMEWKVQKCMMDFERAVTNSFNEAVSITEFFGFM